MSRVADHPVEPLFLDRWSPRSFTGEPIPESVLASAFEAARWAPSSFNAQPWRFVIARPDDPLWPGFLSLLIPRNRKWASRASALVVILSATEVERNGSRQPNGSHSFDTGAAWANFAHQALLLGWHTHGIGGFDREAARGLLQVPDDHVTLAMVAIGRKGPITLLDSEFHDAERPSGRAPLHEFVFEGRFGLPAFSKERNAA